jgi:outer membrane protein TolC
MHPIRRILRPLVGLCWVGLCLSAPAQQAASLAQPLTLENALQLADNPNHYRVQMMDEQIRLAMAEAGVSMSGNDLQVNLSGHLRKVGVSEVGDPNEDNDSQINLFVRKPIYDFGRSAGLDDLAQARVELAQLERAHLVEQRELEIARKYFDVLNADNDFLRHNEDLAIGFIRWDRARENQELGLTSELEVLRLQTEYERIRQNRYQAENQQRYTRVILAESLGFPDSPPSDVALPQLPDPVRVSDDVDGMVQQAFQYSLLMQLRRKQLGLAMLRVRTAENTVTPSLDAELQFSDYAREGSTRDDWRASLYFDFPLYQGQRESAAIGVAQARHRQALAAMQQARSEIRVKVLELWQAIRQNSLDLQGALVDQDYRDMYLDRSRAEYELEFKTDLGDAMVQFSNSRRLAYQARFALELAWRELQQLVGPEYLKTIKIEGDANG